MQPSLVFLTFATFALGLPGPIPDTTLDSAAKDLKRLEKLPFESVKWSKLASKDFRQSDVYRAYESARRQEDGSTAPPPELIKRTPGGIYITTDANWQGTKGYKVQPFNTCIVLDAPWLYTITSFGPDQGTRCILYQRRDCSGASGQTTIWYPGNPNLTNHYGQNWNDRIGSWRCWEDWTTGPSPTSIFTSIFVPTATP